MSDLQKVVNWMLERSYATGHGDMIEDLLKELEWQVAEREREACAKVAESYEPTCDSCPSGVAIAIRSMGIDGAKVAEVGIWGNYQALAQPVMYIDGKRLAQGMPDWKPGMVFKKPKREWVGLTEEDAIDLLPVGEWEIESTLKFAKSIEAKLKEKNA